jgi:hypothetical protein
VWTRPRRQVHAGRLAGQRSVCRFVAAATRSRASLSADLLVKLEGSTPRRRDHCHRRPATAAHQQPRGFGVHPTDRACPACINTYSYVATTCLQYMYKWMHTNASCFCGS